MGLCVSVSDRTHSYRLINCVLLVFKGLKLWVNRAKWIERVFNPDADAVLGDLGGHLWGKKMVQVCGPLMHRAEGLVLERLIE